jgi:hypothetical protein
VVIDHLRCDAARFGARETAAFSNTSRQDR